MYFVPWVVAVLVVYDVLSYIYIHVLKHVFEPWLTLSTCTVYRVRVSSMYRAWCTANIYTDDIKIRMCTIYDYDNKQTCETRTSSSSFLQTIIIYIL